MPFTKGKEGAEKSKPNEKKPAEKPGKPVPKKK
jgi:hypothetical protein